MTTSRPPFALAAWLTQTFADWLDVPAEAIDPGEPLSSYGLDSLRAQACSEAIETRLGIPFGAPLLWEYPTITAMAAYLGAAAAGDEPRDDNPAEAGQAQSPMSPEHAK